MSLHILEYCSPCDTNGDHEVLLCAVGRRLKLMCMACGMSHESHVIETTAECTAFSDIHQTHPWEVSDRSAVGWRLGQYAPRPSLERPA